MNKKIFYVLKIILTITSLVFAVLLKSQIDWNCISNNHFDIDLSKEIIYDFCVGLFSSMILVWFIDETNEHIQEKKSREKEIEKIKRSHKLLDCYIQRYNLLFYCVITPIDKRIFDDCVIPSNFLLKDMKDLYQTTLIISEGLLNSSIECFLKSESSLKEEMEKMIKDIDFSYYPEIRDAMLEFIKVSLKYNRKDSWILKDDTIIQIVQSILADNADELYLDLQNGDTEKTSGNIINAYFLLYEMLKGERKALLKYCQEIKNLPQSYI